MHGGVVFFACLRRLPTGRWAGGKRGGLNFLWGKKGLGVCTTCYILRTDCGPRMQQCGAE